MYLNSAYVVMPGLDPGYADVLFRPEVGMGCIVQRVIRQVDLRKHGGDIEGLEKELEDHLTKWKQYGEVVIWR